MTRPLRVDLAGALYHVTSRGDRREDIFHDASDREDWLSLLEQVCERFNWRCHAYCQMTNHYHVVVETPDANLSHGMRHLNGVYTQRFNRRHGLVGHLFQGRFKGILVERETHLLELARYVVLNPVRAGMVADAAEWRWSSIDHPAHAPRSRIPPSAVHAQQHRIDPNQASWLQQQSHLVLMVRTYNNHAYCTCTVASKTCNI